MSEIEHQSSGKGRKKKSARVDMTAMVDVAFLLLTFFVLTTTLASPAGMDIIKPPVSGDDMTTTQPEKNILTLILGSNDQVYYYQGMPEGDLGRTDFSSEGLRQVIFDHLKQEPNPCGKGVSRPCWDPIIVLKPNKTCRYKNVVDALDELQLSEARKYCYAEMTSSDSLLLLDNRVK